MILRLMMAVGWYWLKIRKDINVRSAEIPSPMPIASEQCNARCRILCGPWIRLMAKYPIKNEMR